uniref:DUF7352 domain-containing protein n=1 Tax=viral metagenome TaxID=1070528 RepID=A0A6M3Y387_9ZZZZ
MHKIFKYPIPADDYLEIGLPEGAQILKVDCQFDKPYLWALVDPLAPTKVRKFRLVGTGHPISEPLENLMFHGTFQLHGGSLIFHIFEIITCQETPTIELFYTRSNINN